MFRGFLRASLLPPKRLNKESETPFVDQMVEESGILFWKIPSPTLSCVKMVIIALQILLMVLKEEFIIYSILSYGITLNLRQGIWSIFSFWTPKIWVLITFMSEKWLQEVYNCVSIPSLSMILGGSHLSKNWYFDPFNASNDLHLFIF